ncbi:MAG TPA: response regulator transcription factor, partial [Puia sp.]|nr:response regulator transcription factor [Puia sp.]
YQVLFDAGSGEECIRQLQAGHVPDILLMDIVMPGMEGYAATVWVRDNYPEVRVLALSTMDAETAIIGMIRSGAKGYLLKDADPVELKRAFDEVMNLGHYYNDLVSRKIIRSVQLPAESKNEPGLQSRLSARESAFLQFICSEKTYADIAREMFVSERTVDGYRDALFKKLNVGSRVGLVIYAIKNHLVTI